MAFSDDLKKELALVPTKHSCCKKALSWGLLLDADHVAGTDQVSLILSNETVIEAVRKLFAGAFGKAPNVQQVTVVGRERYILMQSSRHAAGMLDAWDAGNTDFRQWLSCDDCMTAFLRGALISCSVMNDPSKEAHMEFRFKHASRASVLYPVLAEFGNTPKLVNRKSGCGLYYKKGSVIEDILLQCGAQNAGFLFINDKIEKEIRNTENRVTNCEAKNIQKTVSASHKQIMAIHQIMDVPAAWEGLSEELRLTARLRIENENASLQELLRLHNPAISKSGLNHRLSKLMEIAQSLPIAKKH